MKARLVSTWSNASLLLIYSGVYVLTWGLHAYFTYVCSTYPVHMAPWWLEWLETTFENLASEYHQVGIFILLSKYFIFKGSPQSRDGDDEMKALLHTIQERLKTVEGMNSRP